MTELGVPEFDRYFEALNRFRPFPWQQELASRLLKGGDWPSSINLPTAAGKTAVLDIAVFSLAAQASSAGKKSTGRRIFYIVDRRLIVDGAHERAKSIASKLLDAWRKREGGILFDVAERLMMYGGERPLDTVRLRGAMYRDESWAGSPVQPLICVSTVDQIGSRLLFGGYGLSAGQRPIHAALVANDSLIILDEAHISVPFSETVESVERYRGGRWSELELGLPFRFVQMSATLGEGFSISDADLADAELSRRLRAHKKAKFHKVSDDAKFEEEVVKLAFDLCHGGTFLLVLNTVMSARRVYDGLLKRGAHAVLLTGRSRPYDRDHLMDRIKPRILAGRTPSGEGEFFVVATQCIEVGADFDFDGLITECASMDALVQRFGRVNRLGRNGNSINAIAIRRAQASKPDWLYGEALKETWSWLQKQGKEFDFCPIDLGKIPKMLFLEQGHAPVLLPAYIDAWVQTKPPPYTTPEVGLFLHGRRDIDAEVQIVWRVDLDPGRPEEWAKTVSAFPPSVSEAIPVPLRAFRSWLSSMPNVPVSDIEAVSAPAKTSDGGNPVLRWLGPDDSSVVQGNDVVAGDTVVVPAKYGGADEFGWNPESTNQVPDLAEFVSFERGSAALRLHRKVVKGWLGDPESSQTLTKRVEELPQDPDEEDFRQLLEFMRDTETMDIRIREISSTLLGGRIMFQRHPSGEGWIVRGTKRLGWDEEESSFVLRPVTLSEHSRGVRDRAREFARAIGLSPNIVDDLALAGLLHDVGKVDRRFQIMLHGGDELAAVASGEPLAKSGMDPLDRKADMLARSLSGYPKGARHEALSVSMVQNSNVKPSSKDFDLVLHLVASHHGYSRPFFPPVKDDSEMVRFEFEGFKLEGNTNHGLWRLDSGVSDRFWTLIGRYGYYGLAFLETIVRLADYTQTEGEKRTGGEV